MGNWKLSDKAYRLKKEYEKMTQKKVRGWSWEEETMEDYENYLEENLKALEKSKKM